MSNFQQGDYVLIELISGEIVPGFLKNKSYAIKDTWRVVVSVPVTNDSGYIEPALTAMQTRIMHESRILKLSDMLGAFNGEN